MNDRSKGLLYGFAGVAIYSLSLPGTRLAVIDLPPVFVTGVRLAGSGLISLAYLAAVRASLPRRAEFTRLMIVVLGVVFGFPLFSAFAMLTVDSSHGGVVLALMPFMTAIAAIPLGGERPGWPFFLFAALGTATVFAYVLEHSSGTVTVGDFYLVIAAACAGIGHAAGGALARRRAGLEVIAWALVLALPITLPLVVFGAPGNFAFVRAPSWTGLLYITIFAQFVGFFFFYRGMALGGIAEVGQVQLLQVYMTIAAGAVFLHEPLDAGLLTAAALTILFVWLGRRSQRR